MNSCLLRVLMGNRIVSHFSPWYSSLHYSLQELPNMNGQKQCIHFPMTFVISIMFCFSICCLLSRAYFFPNVALWMLTTLGLSSVSGSLRLIHSFIYYSQVSVRVGYFFHCVKWHFCAWFIRSTKCLLGVVTPKICITALFCCWRELLSHLLISKLCRYKLIRHGWVRTC